MTNALAATAALLVVLALREAALGSEPAIRRRLRRISSRLGRGRLDDAARLAAELRLGVRLRRAGLDERRDAPKLLAAKAVGAVLGAGLASLAAPQAPARLGVLVAICLPLAGFLMPDALLERHAARRRRRIAAALPDVLDMLAVSVGGGRAPVLALAEVARGTGGELSSELGACVAEIECGVAQAVALGRLRERVGGPHLAALAASLDRARRFGTPLAPQLREQAAALRGDQRRTLEEHASRAAPKIQLAVALLLVPAVLLVILAALIANSDQLLPVL